MTTSNKPKRIVKRCYTCGWTMLPRGRGLSAKCSAPIPNTAFVRTQWVTMFNGVKCPCWKERAK